METYLLLLAAVVAAPYIIDGAVQLLNGVMRLGSRLFLRPHNMTEREATLSRAAYGCFMLLLAIVPMAVNGPLFFLRNLQAPVTDWRFWAGAAIPVLLIWGTAWTLIGFGGRSRGERNGRLIYRFLLRIALGVAVLIFASNFPAMGFLPVLVGLFFVITGGVKLALVLRGFPKMQTVDPGMPYGKGIFSKPDDPGWKL